ncbi:hypothetical protein H6F39_17400 [Anabaena sp. FACHB-1250]|uniref:Uncharacterized protein n=1 Tax=Dolichospermum planctonicum TaxID=136072 RepID=A0A480AG12_9CYAN|nr:MULTISPECIES: hypothetical protein [Nostocales]MBD2143081.1 hypothetical protein [Anabaena sp. FACHB-1250]MBD2269894.1 hypothetical protein [Anabaena sp. FACHB-1391]GCL42966.1 hypothetical protein NIES80_26760 [Dolichospermum planctonicum]
MKKALMIKILISSLTCLNIFTPHQVAAQLLPQPWVTVGSKDSEVTYGAGVKVLGFGVEVGRGPEGAMGGDFLKFLSLPFISPYVGIGWYSEDQGVAVSGGVQVVTSDHVFLGAGYNSVRGVNGQIGVKF